MTLTRDIFNYKLNSINLHYICICEIMETVLIQINNTKAYRLLEDLEDLHLITMIKNETPPKQSLSEKYRGKLPAHIADELQKYVAEGRE